MKKKVFWMILVGIVIIAVLFVHYAPVWISVTSVISVAVGCIVGWLAHVLYNRYIAKE